MTSLWLGSADSSEKRKADPSLFVFTLCRFWPTPGFLYDRSAGAPDWSTDAGQIVQIRPPCSGGASGIPSSKLAPAGFGRFHPFPSAPKPAGSCLVNGTAPVRLRLVAAAT